MSGFASTRDQADSLILYIGDNVKESGKPISELSGFHGSIGAPDQQSADRVLEKLAKEGLVEKQEFARVIRRSRRKIAVTHETTAEERKFFEVDLTRKGWSLYEKLKKRLPEGHYGFIAMEFKVPDFTRFVNKVVKPEVKRKTGYELVDMKDVGRAGLIDERMRECIKGAKFVIADLTHDNRGAYWEAGYAEGLGKPVIYTCEEKKFKDKGTHFDTSHLMTVFWSESGDNKDFCKELADTILRSLKQS